MAQTIHFIAIGGAVMHQLAIYLHQQGNRISGSDDVIFDPARAQLEKHGLLPDQQGWFPERVSRSIDCVILGMHARKDNPELARAMELGIPVYSFPEFIYHKAVDKQRVVIAGSHGKTSITSMVMHILRDRDLNFDYLVGSRIEGFDTMVRISDDAPYIIIEGDEYLSSPVDPRSKFLHYRPHLSVISGIAWDHINVFPTFDAYLGTFRAFIDSMPADARVYYFGEDTHLTGLLHGSAVESHAYGAFEAEESEDATCIIHQGKRYPVQVFGTHNMENAMAAALVCSSLGISLADSLRSLEGFSGSARRLELIFHHKIRDIRIFRDFAHAPSKLNASLQALSAKFSDKHILCVYELHTFSSLQPDFLVHYAGSMDTAADRAVFLDSDALSRKGREPIEDPVIREAFGSNQLDILRNKDELISWVMERWTDHCVVALMSSGNFGGLDTGRLTEQLEQGAAAPVNNGPPR